MKTPLVRAAFPGIVRPRHAAGRSGSRPKACSPSALSRFAAPRTRFCSSRPAKSRAASSPIRAATTPRAWLMRRAKSARKRSSSCRRMRRPSSARQRWRWAPRSSTSAWPQASAWPWPRNSCASTATSSFRPTTTSRSSPGREPAAWRSWKSCPTWTSLSRRSRAAACSAELPQP